MTITRMNKPAKKENAVRVSLREDVAVIVKRRAAVEGSSVIVPKRLGARKEAVVAKLNLYPKSK